MTDGQHLKDASDSYQSALKEIDNFVKLCKKLKVQENPVSSAAVLIAVLLREVQSRFAEFDIENLPSNGEELFKIILQIFKDEIYEANVEFLRHRNRHIGAEMNQQS